MQDLTNLTLGLIMPPPLPRYGKGGNERSAIFAGH